MKKSFLNLILIIVIVTFTHFNFVYAQLVQKEKMRFNKSVLGSNYSQQQTLSFDRLNQTSNFKSIHFLIEDNNLPEEIPPKMNPINSVFRFALELGALGAMGYWGYDQVEGDSRYVLMAGVPIAAALAWGIFTFPCDPSRGKDGPVPVSGVTRLLIEGAVFGFASWALYDLGKDALAAGFGSATLLHYTLSLDRIKWLVKQ